MSELLKLKQAVIAAKHGGVPGENIPTSFHTNRGNKLEPGARFVSSSSLNVPTPNDDERGYALSDGEDSSEDIEIDAAEILQPISNPADLPEHPGLREIYTNPFMSQMSRELLDVIVAEKQTLAQISDLFSALLGDDDLAVLPQIVNVVEHEAPYPTPEPGKPLPPFKRDPAAFFKVPKVHVDVNQGLDQAEADELRTKLLESQHLMEGFVHGLTEVRSGIVMSQKLQNDVLGWCREMNGEDYVKVKLDLENDNDNAGLGDRPAKDFLPEHQ